MDVLTLPDRMEMTRGDAHCTTVGRASVVSSPGMTTRSAKCEPTWTPFSSGVRNRRVEARIDANRDSRGGSAGDAPKTPGYNRNPAFVCPADRQGHRRAP